MPLFALSLCGAFHSVEYAGFLPSKFGGLRDQILQHIDLSFLQVGRTTSVPDLQEEGIAGLQEDDGADDGTFI